MTSSQKMKRTGNKDNLFLARWVDGEGEEHSRWFSYDSITDKLKRLRREHHRLLIVEEYKFPRLPLTTLPKSAAVFALQALGTEDRKERFVGTVLIEERGGLRDDFQEPAT